MTENVTLCVMLWFICNLGKFIAAFYVSEPLNK